MAKVTLNPALKSLSGASGNLIFRKVKGQTIAARRPEAKDTDPTPAQLMQRERFRQAAAYAKIVLADPCQRRVYEALAAERSRRADKLVVSDFLTPPVVESIELADYHGRTGDVVRVIATDDIEVVSVAVAIRTAAGRLLEEGSAAKIHGVWVYTAATDAPAGEPWCVTATARDRPGHTGVRTG